MLALRVDFRWAFFIHVYHARLFSFSSNPHLVIADLLVYPRCVLPDLASSFWPYVFRAKLFLLRACLFYCVLPDLAVSLGPFWWFLWHLIFCLYYVSPFLCYSTFCFFAYSYFILFLVDVLQSGIWRDANSLVDLSLRRLVPNLLYLRLESRAPSTVQKYRSGWLKWRQWTAPKIGVQVIPAKPLHVALFISELTVISVSNNTGISSIESVLYGIK